MSSFLEFFHEGKKSVGSHHASKTGQILYDGTALEHSIPTEKREIRTSHVKGDSLLRITSRYPKYLRNLQFFERRIHSIFSQERVFTCLDVYLLTSRVSQHSIAILIYYLSCCYWSVSGLLTLAEGLRKSHWMNWGTADCRCFYQKMIVPGCSLSRTGAQLNWDFPNNMWFWNIPIDMTSIALWILE